jgi:cytochrome c-type biogenesis protein CcmH
MLLWIIFAVMTAAAIVAVLWPLGRGRTAGGGGSDVAVYKDQLQEIDRDRAAGLIGEAEAEAARIEVSRRLLAAAPASEAAAKTVAAKPNRFRRSAAVFAAIFILALVPLSLYLALGSPQLPGAPAYARVAPPGRQSIEDLVARVEDHLTNVPNDGAGWEVLAPVYLRLGRFSDAVEARKKALALLGDSAARQADLGEAIAAAANGVVTAEAKAAFDRALALDPRDAKARYFEGLAAEQDGKLDEAATIWRALLADAAPRAPWVALVRQSLARVSAPPVAQAGSQQRPQGGNPAGNPAEDQAGPQAGPSSDDIAAAANLSEDQRRDMIRGMVLRLSGRLHENGADVEGWLRLVRAYVVLGDPDKARGAADDARRALSGAPDAVKRIDDLCRGLRC